MAVEGHDDLDLISVFDLQYCPKTDGRRDLDDGRRTVTLTPVVLVRPDDERIQPADGAGHDAEGNGALGRLEPIGPGRKMEGAGDDGVIDRPPGPTRRDRAPTPPATMA